MQSPPSVTLHPRKHPERFPSFLCTSPTTVATGAPRHIRHLMLVGRGLSTALCATQEGCTRHPSTSSPEGGSYRAPTYLSQHSPGDTHRFPSVLLLNSTTPGRKQVPQGSAAGVPSIPSPPQAGLWLVSATACFCHKPLVACSFRGRHQVQSLPSHAFSPPVHLLGHTETMSASPFIKLPPVAVLQWELGSVQLGPDRHTGLSLELGPAI